MFSVNPLATSDAEWIPATSLTSDQTVLHAGQPAGAATNVVFNFPSVTIPKRATINSATLTIKTVDVGSEESLRLLLDAQDTDDATLPANAAAADAMTITGFGPEISAISSNAEWTLLDFADAIQDVVNRSGWDNGNAMNIVLKDNGSISSTACEIQAFEDAPENAARLNVTYTPVTGYTHLLTLFAG